MKKNPHLFDAKGVSLLNYDHLVAENDKLRRQIDRLKRRLKAIDAEVEPEPSEPQRPVLH